MQAIARTNRPAAGKENGEIVDFQGVFENIDEALDYDAEMGFCADCARKAKPDGRRGDTFRY